MCAEIRVAHLQLPNCLRFIVHRMSVVTKHHRVGRLSLKRPIYLSEM